MRRKEREVTDSKEILEILNRNSTIRIGLHGDEYPYVVPVSFGLDLVDDQPILYFHCAGQGRKLDLIRQNQKVCIEGDILHRIEGTGCALTARYESVIGFGVCEEVEDPAEIIKGLSLIIAHYGRADRLPASGAALAQVKVYKILVQRITGKRNLPAGNP